MKTFAIAGRIIRQILNDPRSLALILVAPLFLFTLMYLLLGKSGYQPKIAESGIPEKLVSELRDQGMTVKGMDRAEAEKELKNQSVDAFFTRESGREVLLFETQDAVKTGIVQKKILTAMKKLTPGSALNTEYLYGKTDESLFDSLGYVLLGIISFFIVFIMAGISFVRERTNQTMERLMMTPVKRWQVVLGYTLGFGFFAVLQSIILLCFVKWALGLTVAGSMLTAALMMILLSLSAVCMGAFFSIFSNNEFQIMQLIPVVVIPQIFFSGMISLQTIPYHLGLLSKIMPVYYACDALQSITVRGRSAAQVFPDILALLIYIAVFFILNVFALKKYRKV